MSAAIEVEREKRFDWPVCYDAENWVLEQLDAICKAEGYASKTHPAIEAAEYAQLVEDTADVLRTGGARRGSGTERDEA